MTRLVIVVAWIAAACSGASKPPSAPDGAGAGSGEVAAPAAKKVALTWGIEKQSQAGEAMADVFLATTDETGKQVSHPIGRYKGTCSVISPAPEMKAVTGVACRTGATGTELHAVIQGGADIVVLQLGVDEGVKQDPMARKEIARIKVPVGTKIEVGG
jgi:hypothetical protein